jgi:hypothetical protein
VDGDCYLLYLSYNVWKEEVNVLLQDDIDKSGYLISKIPLEPSWKRKVIKPREMSQSDWATKFFGLRFWCNHQRLLSERQWRIILAMKPV